MPSEKICVFNEIKCDAPVNRICVSGDEVFCVNKESGWEVKRVYTDTEVDNHKEIIVVLTRQKKESDKNG